MTFSLVRDSNTQEPYAAPAAPEGPGRDPRPEAGWGTRRTEAGSRVANKGEGRRSFDFI